MRRPHLQLELRAAGQPAPARELLAVEPQAALPVVVRQLGRPERDLAERADDVVRRRPPELLLQLEQEPQIVRAPERPRRHGHGDAR